MIIYSYRIRLSWILQIIARGKWYLTRPSGRVRYHLHEGYNLQYSTKPSSIIVLSYTSYFLLFLFHTRKPIQSIRIECSFFCLHSFFEQKTCKNSRMLREQKKSCFLMLISFLLTTLCEFLLFRIRKLI